MRTEDYENLMAALKSQCVERPNKSDNGELAGHAAGEPFEKLTYHILKDQFPERIFKQHEYLNDLFLRHPTYIIALDRIALFKSEVARFLLSRSYSAITNWSPNHQFEEKQNDTADILWVEQDHFDIIDVKTRNMSKKAMPPNIISSFKLAKACAKMIEDNDFESIDIHYVEVEWKEEGKVLRCENAYWKDLFKCDPKHLYINWAAALQIQFHVSELDQSFCGTQREWAQEYLRIFVDGAKRRCNKMMEDYVLPFSKYLSPEK